MNWDFPFRFVADWYEHQYDYVNHLPVTDFTNEPLYRDEARVWEVVVFKKKILLQKSIRLSLYGNRVVLDEGQENQIVLPFEDVYAVVVLGRNKLNIYHKDRIYQFKGSPRFNALKYVNIYHRYKNLVREDGSNFLGL